MMPDLSNVKLWRVCLLLLILANVAFFSHNIFGWIVTLVFFLYIPGFLLLKRIVKSNVLGLGSVSLSIGLSLSLMTVSGLILNSLHFLGMQRPLETMPTFAALDLMVLILIAFNWFTRIDLRINIPHLKREELLFFILFSLLPILSVFGAIRLNNGASNLLTMILIGLIGLLYITLMFRPDMKKIYPYAVFTTAIAILFCISLRGWSITGHDIHHEYNVFTSTLNRGYWSPLIDKGDPYNACLSITILPTLLAKITAINPIYIYKIIYQIIFASMVPALYFFAKRFANDKKALLGIFAFMTFPTFTNDLPFLNRQEIAFGYFILILFVNFSRMTYRAKSILTVLLLLTIILSHYSTSYVSVSVLLLASIIYKILSKFYKTPPKLSIPIISLPIIIMAVLATFVWNVQITASSSNLSSTLTSTVNGILGKNKDASSFSSYGLLSNKRTLTPSEQLAQSASKDHVAATYVPDYKNSLTVLGHKLSAFINVPAFSTQLHALIAKILQLLVVIGTIFLAIYYRRKAPSPHDVYFLSVAISFLVALVLFTFLPQLSIGYDVTRLFQQSMMLLWLPVIFLCSAVFSRLGKLQLPASASLLVFLYFNLSGFIPQLTGGFLPTLSLNNSGVYYDYFYTHKSDIVGTSWLAEDHISYMNIFMDINSASPPLKFPVAVGLINGVSQGYYYKDYTNKNSGKYRTILNSGFAEYTSPDFTNNKNLIYTNGGSEIYFKWPDYQ